MFRSWPFAAALCAPVHAQTPPDTCDVKRNNEPYFYWDSATHPNGRNFNHEVYQPPGFATPPSGGPGVGAGSYTWRWIPGEVNDRRTSRDVSGFYVYLRPTAATTQFPHMGYIPQFAMHDVAPRVGGGFEPLLPPAQPLLIVPQVSLCIPEFAAYRARTAFSTAVNVPLSAQHPREVAFSLQWQGGEHRYLDGSQAMIGTTDEAPWDPPTWGVTDSASNITVRDPFSQYGQYTTVWASYYEAEPSIIAESDFAHQRRTPPSLPLFTGFNDAAGLCDLSANSVDFGWNADCGTSNGGAYCIPLFNVTPSLPTATTPFLGLTFEIDLGDPLLGLIAVSGYGGFADSSGFFNGPRLTFAADPTMVGRYFGMEFLVMSNSLVDFVGTTQAHWIEVR